MHTQELCKFLHNKFANFTHWERNVVLQKKLIDDPGAATAEGETKNIIGHDNGKGSIESSYSENLP